MVTDCVSLEGITVMVVEEIETKQFLAFWH